ncbi:hypothetical protein ACOSP7_025526 [Xanthoceras sorbifolium]
MERKSCCGSSRSYVPSSCVSAPKKETTPVIRTPKKEENVNPEFTTKKEAAQAGVIQTPKLRRSKL